MVLEGKRCIGAHLHGVSSSPWARRSTRRGEPASGEKRRGEREREREKLFLYLSLVVSRRGCWEREKDSWRNQDEEEDFLLTCGFLLLCGGALRHPARTMHFSHTFPDFYLPIGCVYQSANRECRRRGFDAATMWSVLLFFSLAKPTSIKFPTRWFLLFHHQIRCSSSVQM